MFQRSWYILILAAAVIAVTSGHAASSTQATQLERDAEVIATERAALDRYQALDPEGYLNLYAPDATYFDPMTERRVDGLKAIQEWLAPVKKAKIPFTDRRYELIGPKVQHYGDVAVLTYNLINYGKPPKKPEQPLTRWNVTEVYRRVDAKWVIVHSHFSFIKPDVKRPGL